MSDVMYSRNKLTHGLIECYLNNPESWNSSGHTIYGFQNIHFDQFNFSGKKLSGLTFNNCNLDKCLFTNTEFNKVEFVECDINDTNFSQSDLKYTRFNFCNMEYSRFDSCKLLLCKFVNNKMGGCTFKKSKPNTVSFYKVDLDNSDWGESEILFNVFENSTLKNATMTNLRFIRSGLRRVSLIGTNFSGSSGFLDSIEYIDANFGEDASGLIVYKIFDIYQHNPKWIVKEDSVITEIVNPDRTDYYGCGIHVGSEKWLANYIRTNTDPKHCCGVKDIWQCYIRREWLSGVIVPYETDGEIRTSRLQLYKKLSDKEINEILEDHEED